MHTKSSFKTYTKTSVDNGSLSLSLSLSLKIAQHVTTEKTQALTHLTNIGNLLTVEEKDIQGASSAAVFRGKPDSTQHGSERLVSSLCKDSAANHRESLGPFETTLHDQREVSAHAVPSPADHVISRGLEGKQTKHMGYKTTRTERPMS